jgi:hypothetical protein
MNSQFNAIDYAQQLEAAGVSQAQADVHAKMLSLAMTSCAASKGDLAALDAKLTARMDLFEARIAKQIGEFETRVEHELAGMRVEIAEIRAEMKYDRRMIHLVLAFQVALLVKLFLP